MAFTVLSELSEKSGPASLLTVGRLQLMSDRQFKVVADYWRGIRALGGPLQTRLANAMLGHVLRVTDLVRQAQFLSPSGQEAMADDVATLGKYALGGLALSQLLQTAFSRHVAEGELGAIPGALGVDMTLIPGERNFFMVHHPREGVHDIFPAGEDGRLAPRYENETLVVTAIPLALPTTEFSEGFKALSGGEPFVPENYATLKPELKPTYIPNAPQS